ncbi:MAG: EAL domain-containing protein [Methylobacter sp.]|nr:EAL domain-containing protein [Methylobacter sp.]MDP2098005.1 EAL domain-containing protein [Methylobacter sp.]MDP2427824.1 EAL domain-containing protein [Methylobacter sp.]MDP3055080.1 EAL domain-containing protein [Methylobacter sp.]MDP3362055.1 EAL domain-containing protein [Methylobacter sp.]
MSCQSFREVIVESVTFLDSVDPPRWKGRLQLPGRHRPVDILIFNIQGEFKAVPARCSHEGYDLTHCPLLNENILVCPAHSLRTDLKLSEFRVREYNGQFLVSINEISLFETVENRIEMILGSEDSETVLQLREEIDKLQLANLKQQRQILVITQSMDAMLCESEQQKAKLQNKANQQQVLSRFVDRVMDTMDDLLFVIDTEGRIRRLNTGVERELGFTEAELLGTGIDDLLPPAEQQSLARHLPTLPWPIRSVLLETVRLNGCYTGEHELLRKSQDTSKAIYWLKSGLLHSEQGKLEGAVVTALNITELKDRETRLRLSTKVFNNTSEAIFITDPQGTILEVNTAFSTITGYQRFEVLGKNPRILRSKLHDRPFYKQMWKSLLNEGGWKGEIWDRRKNGEFCPMLLSINAVTDNKGQLTHYVAIATDISHQKQTEQELTQLAYYDVLTSLPNRFLFKDRFEHEICLAQRNNARLALFFLDLDHFKNVNDTLGHWAGDSLLQIIATRIQNCLRKSDTVARMGGDEFTIILPGLIGITDATELARKLVDAMTRPVQIKDYTVFVGVSIGIAIFPDDGNDFDTLTRHADTAMYAAKAKGRGMFQYFETGMNEAAHQRLSLENALRLAIEQEEFQLYYQPKADSALSRITGAEALIRWKRPGFGIVPPDRFIPIAEETALIIPLGKWILRTACLQAGEWADKRDGFRIAINLSPLQLLADDFIAVLDHILAETGTHPEWIELEVTEGLVMHDIEKAAERLHQIRERGIHVAMDDFGTGYSSLSYLQKLPIQTLKIDRSFILAYRNDPDSNEAAFIKTIVSLGQVLNMKVIAEGVETESQLTLLQSFGCHEIQGYYLSPPLPADEFQKRWIDRL